MQLTRQQEWITDLMETAPSIIFLVLWRGGWDPELAGWTGSFLAAALLIGFRLRRIPYNSILLGINLHLLVITPLIVASFRMGFPDFGHTLLSTAESAVLVVVFAVGCLLTLVSARGFVGSDRLSPSTRRTYSLVLLALCGATIPWSFAHTGQSMLSIVVPLMALFGARRFLIARALDRTEPSEDRDDRASMAVAVPSGQVD